MKKNILLFIAVLTVLGMYSCEKCKDCRQDVSGQVTTPAEEYCGDDLEEIEDTPGWTCE